MGKNLFFPFAEFGKRDTPRLMIRSSTGTVFGGFEDKEGATEWGLADSQHRVLLARFMTRFIVSDDSQWTNVVVSGYA